MPSRQGILSRRSIEPDHEESIDSASYRSPHLAQTPRIESSEIDIIRAIPSVRKVRNDWQTATPGRVCI